MTLRTITYILSLIGFFCILLSGCISEELSCPDSPGTIPPEKENILRLQLSCQGRNYGAPSRAVQDGNEDENRINTVSIYIYNAVEGKLLQSFLHMDVRSNQNFQTTGILTLNGINSSILQGQKKIYVVANETSALQIPQDYSSLMGVITPPISGEIHVAPGSPLLMSGEKNVDLTNYQAPVQIEVERTVAKVCVKVGKHTDCPENIRIDNTGIMVQMRNVPVSTFLYKTENRTVGDNSPIRNMDYSLRATKTLATNDNEIIGGVIDFSYVNENPYITPENSQNYGTALEISIPTIKKIRNEIQSQVEEVRVVDNYIVYVNGGKTLRNHIYTLNLLVKEQGKLPGVELAIAPWDEYKTNTPIYGTFLELSSEGVAVPVAGAGKLLFRTSAPSVKIDWSTDTEGWLDHSQNEIPAPAGVEQGSGWSGVIAFKWDKLPSKDTKVRIKIEAGNLSKYITVTCGDFSEVVGGDNGIVVPDWDNDDEDLSVMGTYIVVPARELRSSVAEMPFSTDAKEVRVEWEGDPGNLLVHDTEPIKISGNQGVLKLNWTSDRRPAASEDLWVTLCAGNIKVRIYIRYSDGVETEIPGWNQEGQETPVEGVELMIPAREVYIYNGMPTQLFFQTNIGQESVSVDWSGDTGRLLDHSQAPVVAAGEGYIWLKLDAGKKPDSHTVIPLVLKAGNVKANFTVICEESPEGDIPDWGGDGDDLSVMGTYLFLEQNKYNLKDTNPFDIEVWTDASKVDITWEGNTEWLVKPPASVAVADGKAVITCMRNPQTQDGMDGTLAMILHVGNITRKITLTFLDPLPDGTIPGWEDGEDVDVVIQSSYLTVNEKVNLQSDRRAELKIQTDASRVDVDWTKAPDLVSEQTGILTEQGRGILYLKWRGIPTSGASNVVVLTAGRISRAVTVTCNSNNPDDDQALATYLVFDKDMVTIDKTSNSCEVGFQTDSRDEIRIDWSMDRNRLFEHTDTPLRANEGKGRFTVTLGADRPAAGTTIPVTVRTDNIAQTVLIKIE